MCVAFGDAPLSLSRLLFFCACSVLTNRCGVFLPVQEVNALFRRFDVKGEGFADAEVGGLKSPCRGPESRQDRMMVIRTLRYIDLVQ